MSGARTIEVSGNAGWEASSGLGPIVTSPQFAVRLCDGAQILAERGLDVRSERDARDWELARSSMIEHDRFGRLHRRAETVQFKAAIRVLFPEFGTVPDGVETNA